MRRDQFVMPDYRIAYAEQTAEDHWDESHPAAIQRTLDTLPVGCSILVCHPGYIDETLEQYSTMIDNRPRERALFCQNRWPHVAAERGIQILNYLDLLKETPLSCP
jgi:predicted glycoside hydrolase/deacetylase ChbG (UPF0249 family)